MPTPSDPAAGGSQPVSSFEPARRHVGVGPDSDGDGLSDDFEANVFGSDPAAKDGDGDGLNDWAEYWLDSKPRDNDTDRDGWLDGEDLAFGDPLRWNSGGAERTELRERSRRQFDAEGTDKDKDWLRDHLESSEGTKTDNPDSDNDGLSDGVEVQLRNSGVTTSQDSTPDDTTDLDFARERLGERRAASDAMPQSSSSVSDEPAEGELVASESANADILAAPSYDAVSLGGSIAAVEQPPFDGTDSFAAPPDDVPEAVADVSETSEDWA